MAIKIGLPRKSNKTLVMATSRLCIMSQWFLLQVNYRYVLDRITANNQAYVHLGEIAASQQVSSLLEPEANFRG